jgi:MFS family permease
MNLSAAKPRQRLFHGWVVVAAAFVVMGLGFGCAYTFSAFLVPLQREFAASRGEVSLVFSLAGFLYFALGVVSGPLADRWGARRVIVLGMVLVGTGLALAGVARTLLQVDLAYGLGVGLGVGFSYVPAVAVVQRWFVRRRGLASGLAVSGIGVGTLAMPPLASWLIEALGWRHAYVALGAIALVAGVLSAWWIADDPRQRGLVPDGEAPPASAGAPATEGLTLREAVRSRLFIGLYVACLVCSFGLFVPFAHLVPYALDHGVASSRAVLLLGVIGIGSTAGRFLLGGLADRVGRHRALVLMFTGMALAMVVWWRSSAWLGLAVFAFAYGVFYGGFVAVLPALVMDRFGARRVSSIIGVLYTSVALGTLIGPSAAGYAHDFSGSYGWPIVGAALANLLAAAIVAALAKTPPLDAQARPA